MEQQQRENQKLDQYEDEIMFQKKLNDIDREELLLHYQSKQRRQDLIQPKPRSAQVSEDAAS